MQSFASSRHLILIAVLLGIAHIVYPIRPSVLLKRSLLRRRLMTMPGYFRPKRQLFREDIPHHRPLTGNTYYLHAGFPHPSRWHDGSQVIPPDPNPITHHHLHKKPGLHDDVHSNNNHNHNNNNDHHNNHVNHGHQHQLIRPRPHPPTNQHFHQNHHHHHNGFDVDGQGEPMAISVVNNQTPHTVNIHSAIVHSNGAYGGSVVDNSLGNPPPHPPISPANQANFDPLLAPYISSGPDGPAIGNYRNAPGKKPGHKQSKPHSEPEPYDDYGTGGGGGDYDTGGINDQLSPHLPPESGGDHSVHQKQPDHRKPKTIIHYHPVTVGNIINFNDDNKPVTGSPNPALSYGPPEHVPGIPLSNKDVLSAISEPFMKSPFKTVNGPPSYLDFTKDDNNIQYGPPQHVPGVPFGSLDLAPMMPSFGPPIKSEAEPPYGVALPVIAHLHSGPPRPYHHRHRHPPKRYKGKGRGHPHHHHLHLHHIHHPPAPPVHTPLEGGSYLDVKHPSYVVHGHVPNKFVSFHGPHFRSHSHHHHKSFWSW